MSVVLANLVPVSTRRVAGLAEDRGRDMTSTEAGGPKASAAGSDLRVFAYTVTEKAEIYLAVVEALMIARERFRLQLRPSEVLRELHLDGHEFRLDGKDFTVDDVGTALEQLAAWGNVSRFYDSAAPETLAEFYGKRYLYQLTQSGWAAHEGVRAVQRAGLAASGRLSGVLLPAIVERLEALRTAGEEDPADGARLYSLCMDLFAVFSELADNSARYMSDLAVAVSDLAGDDDRFLTYKRAVFAYLNDFVARFAEVLPRIQALVGELASAMPELLAAAASTDVAPTPVGTDEGPLVMLQERWAGVAGWFLPDGERQPVADSLRVAMLEALNRILVAVGRLNERHLRRASREADFVQLAHWFAASADQAAHELWDQTFGLWGARHFVQLAGDEEVDRRRSFWEAEPAAVAPRLRATGRRGVPGRPGTGADYRAVKLAKVAALRALRTQAAAAAERLAACTPTRLSELRRLDRQEFAQFLELVGAALASPARADGTRSAVTPTVRVTLRPVVPATRARVWTASGTLRCPDHLLSIALTERLPQNREALG
jgi:uncharacterized protein (TIGR02677 family)